MNSIALALSLLIALATQALAASPKPADFAYGCPLPAADDGGVYSVLLPLRVYERVTQAALGDLRVFNGAGETVPHTVRRSEIEQNRKETRKSLPFFPLVGTDAERNADLAMRVSRSAAGAVVTVDMGRQSAEKASWAYLVDTSGTDAVPVALELEWTGNAKAVLALTLSQSSDLTHWQPLVDRVVLADLHYRDQAIVQRRITLRGKTMPYIRIDCLGCTESPQLQAIAAVFQSTPSRQSSQWLDLPAQKTGRGQAELTYEYELTPKVTITGLQLALPMVNSLVQASIESRASQNDPWQLRHSGQFYSLELEGNQLGNSPVACAPLADRFWRIRVVDNGTGFQEKDRAPLLKLGWQPDELLFVGRGQGPYTLAFGSTSQNTVPGTGGELILGALREARSESLIRRIEPGPVHTLGGEQAVIPRVAATTWKKIALWMVLIAGVGLLALMTRTIVREMGKKAGE